MTMAKVFKLAP